MGFWQEIVQKTGQVFSPWRITWLEGGCFVEGVKRMLCVSPTKIEVQTAAGAIAFYGTGLAVRAYHEGDAVVVGKLFRIERTKREIKN